MKTSFRKSDNVLADTAFGMHSAELLLLGGSAGSFGPIFQIIKALPNNFEQAVLIILHRGKNNFSDIDNLFRQSCRLPVVPIVDKEKINGGTVYIAPANYHVLIENNKTFALDVSEPVWYSKPSIDVTFESAADVYGGRCVAVLFSGANHDGANGLLRLKEHGGFTIVQNPKEAEMEVMPMAAINKNAAGLVLDTDELIQLITNNYKIKH